MCEDRKTLIVQYWAEGLGQRLISKTTGMTFGTVAGLIDRMNLKVNGSRFPERPKPKNSPISVRSAEERRQIKQKQQNERRKQIRAEHRAVSPPLAPRRLTEEERLLRQRERQQRENEREKLKRQAARAAKRIKAPLPSPEPIEPPRSRPALPNDMHECLWPDEIDGEVVPCSRMALPGQRWCSVHANPSARRAGSP